jgi:hypothetical protein
LDTLHVHPDGTEDKDTHTCTCSTCTCTCTCSTCTCTCTCMYIVTWKISMIHDSSGLA